jgi:hypothetical protein
MRLCGMLVYNTYEDPALPLGRRWVCELTVMRTPEDAEETEVFLCAGGFPRVRVPPSSQSRETCPTVGFHSTLHNQEVGGAATTVVQRAFPEKTLRPSFN